MSINLPLTVRIKTRREDVDVTAQIGDLRFRSAIPGGYASLEISLNRSLRVQPDDIEYFARVYVYDGRNGHTIWEGRLQDPGRGAGDQGEVWSIAAIGPWAHASDRTVPLIYIDTSLDRWTRSAASTPPAETSLSEFDPDNPSLQIRSAEGTTVTTSWQGDWIYRSIFYAGQKVARVRADWVAETSSVNLNACIFARQGNGASLFNTQIAWQTSPTVIAAQTASGGWNLAIDVVSFRATRSTSTLIAPSTFGIMFWGVTVRSILKDAAGADITSAYATNVVLASEVVTDLLGRLLDQYDGANAVVTASGVSLDQLAYPDGVTAAQVFDDLAVSDPGIYPAVWESNDADLYRFEYRSWPTTVRYEANVVDGFDSPGSASELYNAVTVRWLDARGRIRTTRRTQVVQELVDAGNLTREFFIDISDEMGSELNAIAIGDNFLIEHQYPPNAGTLQVARPILDNDTGRMVAPWEILPGHLIRVQGVMPRVDALNPVARDGVTIFRVISVEFSASECTATLELDSYSRTVARALANLANRRPRKR